MKKSSVFVLALLSGVSLAQNVPSAPALRVFTTYKKVNAEAVAADYNAARAARKVSPITFNFVYADSEDAAQQLAQLRDTDVVWLSNALFFDKLRPDQQYAAPERVKIDVPLPLPKMTAGHTWLPLSVRMHGLVYNTDTIKPDALPKRLLDLPKVSRLKGRIGWGANTPSFTDLVAAMIAQYGEATTRQWLTDMQKLQPRDFGSEVNGLTEAVNSGELDVSLGLSSNATRGRGSSYHLGLYTFDAGDVGNAAEYSGVAALKGSHQAQALAFARYLTGAAPQLYMAAVNFDQPLYTGKLLPANAIPGNYDKLLPALDRSAYQKKATSLFVDLDLW